MYVKKAWPISKGSTSLVERRFQLRRQVLASKLPGSQGSSEYSSTMIDRRHELGGFLAKELV